MKLELSQEMINSGTMEQVFTAHYVTATALNSIQEHSSGSKRAIAVAGREFEIVDGVISIVPLPEPEPVIGDPEVIEE